MPKKRRSRVPATARDTRRPIEAEPVDEAMVKREQARLLDQVANGELDFRGVFDVRGSEDVEASVLFAQETAWLKRRRDEPPARSGASVPRIASSLRVRQVVEAHRDLQAAHIEMILAEYEFDGDWRIDEIGSAEADVLTSAIRLVLRATR